MTKYEDLETALYYLSSCPKFGTEDSIRKVKLLHKTTEFIGRIRSDNVDIDIEDEVFRYLFELEDTRLGEQGRLLDKVPVLRIT